MFYKDRVFKGFRSLYAQWPAQSSVLGRTIFFNAEVAEYTYKGHIAIHNHSNLAQEGIDERILWFSVQSVNESPGADQLVCITFTGGECNHIQSHC